MRRLRNSRSSHIGCQYSVLETRNLLATFAEAGIEQRTIDYIEGLESNWSDLVLNDAATQNTLEGIISSRQAPADATLITSESQFSQIVSGGTYLIQGDLTVTGTLQVPDDVTIYVDGSIYKEGAVSTTGSVHSIENYDDAIFYVSTDNVRLYGINNALLHGNPDLSTSVNHASAIIIRNGGSNVHVEGFEIANVWEGVVAHWNTADVVIENNYVHDILGRAIWLLGTDRAYVAHNFIENTGMDGIDFDAYTEDSYAYENVVVGAGRWAGFVEEGANNNYLVRGVAVMADLGNPNTGFQMGWADNGTSQNFTGNNPGLITRDNYFIDNVVFRPTSGWNEGGNYFAKTGEGTEKGMTYFWANRAYGTGHATGDFFYNAELLTDVPWLGGLNNSVHGQDVLEDLDQRFNQGWLDLIDESFTAYHDFTAADLRDQADWGGQGGSPVDPVGGTVSTPGGSWLRNSYATSIFDLAERDSLRLGDRISIKATYRMDLPSLDTNLKGGIFGFKDSISNGGGLTPDFGFSVGMQGGQVRFESSGVNTDLAPAEFGLSATDLASDWMEIVWVVEYTAAQELEVVSFDVRNASTDVSTSLNLGSTYAIGDDLFYTQGLALNGNAGFAGTLGNIDVELLTGAVATVEKRAVGYAGSVFDSGVGLDPAAIDSGKRILLPGETATFANYSSYYMGINALVVDIAALASPDLVSADDFTFRTGNGDTFDDFAELTGVTASVSVDPAGGDNGADRILITFPDEAITNTWLQVTVEANERTGLSSPDVFYFGNAIGDTGNSATNALASADDIGNVRNNLSGFSAVGMDSPYDINRDGRVSATDIGIIRNNLSGFFGLNLITAPQEVQDSGTAGAFIEVGGAVVIETESAELPNGWVARTADDIPADDPQMLNGYTGTGFIEWTGGFVGGGTLNPANAQAVIRYEIEITNPGVYELRWRTKQKNGDQTSDANNDTFVRWASGTTPDGDQDFGSVFTKVYVQNKTDWVVNMAANPAHAVFYHNQFRRYLEPGTHAIELNARSSGHVIDRLIVLNTQLAGGFGQYTTAAQSPRVGGSASSASIAAAEPPRILVRDVASDIETALADSVVQQSALPVPQIAADQKFCPLDGQDEAADEPNAEVERGSELTPGLDAALLLFDSGDADEKPEKLAWSDTN